MTKEEFIRKHVTQARDGEDAELRDLTALLEGERKAAKIEGFEIARRLYDRNPAAFREILTTLIEAKPPREDNTVSLVDVSHLCQHLQEDLAARQREPFLYGNQFIVPASLKCARCEQSASGKVVP